MLFMLGEFLPRPLIQDQLLIYTVNSNLSLLFGLVGYTHTHVLPVSVIVTTTATWIISLLMYTEYASYICQRTVEHFILWCTTFEVMSATLIL